MILGDISKNGGISRMPENKRVTIKNILYSKDNVSRKYIQTTDDNFRIETSYVNYINILFVFQLRLDVI